MSDLLPVREALERVLAVARSQPVVEIALSHSTGRVLASDLKSNRTQPAFAASAMDGYAVRYQDLALQKPLTIIGEAAAGHGYGGSLSENEAVRIFTGAPMPKGSDTVLLQEEVQLRENTIHPQEMPAKGDYVRPEGMDFQKGDVLLKKGTTLDFLSLSLCAAMNHPVLPVFAKPKVGILSNGDELVAPGTTPKADQIIASNAYGIESLVEKCGGEPLNLGIVGDDEGALQQAFLRAQTQQCDVIVTLGGASVGDHDLIRPTLLRMGASLDFWKIAMRPGKPFMFGQWQQTPILGMPGNPVSSIVCSLLFLKPLLHAMTGKDPAYDIQKAILGSDLPENSLRQAYLRAKVETSGEEVVATAFQKQDSSLLSVLARSNALIIRKPHAPPAKAGEDCEIMWL